MHIKAEIKNLPDSEVEIISEIEADVFEAEREKALKKLGDSVKIDGFRSGHIPEKVLIEKIGEHVILEEMAEIAIQKVYPTILEENDVKAVGYPQVTITKIAKNNPLEFKIKTAVVPEIKMPDYTEIAKKQNGKKEEKLVVEEKEVDEAIEHLRKTRIKKGENGEEVLPELDDEFAKSLGKFETVLALKEKMKENILLEKEKKQKDKKRMEVMEAVIEKMKVSVPKILIDSEISKMLEETKHYITQAGLKWEDYLTQAKKTEEDIKKDLEKEALKRVKFGLALDSIADSEKIEVSDEELEKESQKLVAYYKNFGQEIHLEQAKSYIYRTLRNDRVFKFLEEIK